MPPTANDASRMPAVTDPPPMTIAPTAGKSTIGWPNVIAMMSTTKLIRTLGARRRCASPSTTERKPPVVGRSPSGRMRGRVQRPKNPAKKSTTSTV